MMPYLLKRLHSYLWRISGVVKNNEKKLAENTTEKIQPVYSDVVLLVEQSKSEKEFLEKLNIAFPDSPMRVLQEFASLFWLFSGRH
jgi:hypothetical protein